MIDIKPFRGGRYSYAASSSIVEMWRITYAFEIYSSRGRTSAPDKDGWTEFMADQGVFFELGDFGAFYFLLGSYIEQYACRRRRSPAYMH